MSKRMPAGSSDPPLIELRSATRLYANVLGVNDINLSLSQGAWGLLGPNGAGKSTTVSMMTRHTTPSRGDAYVWDTDFDSEPSP